MSTSAARRASLAREVASQARAAENEVAQQNVAPFSVVKRRMYVFSLLVGPTGLDASARDPPSRDILGHVLAKTIGQGGTPE